MSIELRGERWLSASSGPSAGRATNVAPHAPSKTIASTERSPFAKVLARVADAVARTDATIDAAERRALHGGNPAELLVLQTSVARSAEMVTLSAKLVDSVTNGVRTVLAKTE